MDRLLILRFAALRYIGRGCDLLQYLLRGMLDYSLNFATFEGLEDNVLRWLQATLKPCWKHNNSDEEWPAGLVLLELEICEVICQSGHQPMGGEEEERDALLTGML